MHPRMLEYYEQELAYFHESAREFASAFGKAGERLSLGGDEVPVPDPYVERLLEGVSFLAARIRLKLDAEFPRFTQHLLEAVFPHYAAPTPSMMVAQFQPSLTEGGLADGFVVPRGSLLRTRVATDRDTRVDCQFRTGQDLTLWPIEIGQVSYVPFAPDLPLSRLPLTEPVHGVLRLKLRATASLTFSQVALDRLSLFLAGNDAVAFRLYELLLAGGLGVLVVPPGSSPSWFEWLPATAIQPSGFGPDQALLPCPARSFDGYRLLREYFAFPDRFRFVELAGLRRALARHRGSEIELAIPLSRGDATLAGQVGKDTVALHCTPAVNLFSKHTDRIHVTDGVFEHHVVPDRTRPMDFEVYRIESVSGYGGGAEAQQTFRPFYSAVDGDLRADGHGYFTVRREPRLLSEAQRKGGARSATGYVGSEVFLSLVDARQAPYASDLRQLAVEALVTNRDLPVFVRSGGDTAFTMAAAAPYEGISAIRGPSRPQLSFAEGELAWRLVNHLSLNYLALSDVDGDRGAAALRELLALYTTTAAGGKTALSPQVDAVRHVAVSARTRRLPVRGPIVFARGLEVRVTVDEAAFTGGSALLLGAVLEQFSARMASMNTFTEFALLSQQRGEIKRWPPRMGRRQIL
jgi:type VI secretion system protein ImpG